MPPCKSDRRSLDDQAVSEIIGFLLTFGIISSILVLAMIGFGSAQQRSYEKVAEAQADSIAQRVSSVLVDAAIFLESANSCAAQSQMRLSLLLELPTSVASRGFDIDLNATAGTVVVGTGIAPDQESSLFGAAQATTCSLADRRPTLCPNPGPSSSASGGNLFVIFDGSCLGVSNTPVST